MKCSKLAIFQFCLDSLDSSLKLLKKAVSCETPILQNQPYHLTRGSVIYHLVLFAHDEIKNKNMMTVEHDLMAEFSRMERENRLKKNTSVIIDKSVYNFICQLKTKLNLMSEKKKRYLTSDILNFIIIRYSPILNEKMMERINKSDMKRDLEVKAQMKHISNKFTQELKTKNEKYRERYFKRYGRYPRQLNTTSEHS